jgi:hypothetical protein
VISPDAPYLANLVISPDTPELTNLQLTAFGNAVWGASYLAFAVGCASVLKKNHLLPDVRQSLSWAIVSAVCIALHRGYWNLAIFLAPAGENYHPWFLAHKPYLLVLIGLIVLGLFKTTQPFIPEDKRITAMSLAGLWLVSAGVVSIYLS